MSKHTPGPWHYAECQMGTPFVDTESVGDLLAAALPLDEEKANAHLIAAAPDLLAACEMWVNAETVSSTTQAHEMASRAIAKARGK
jgi:hypothetical protein